MTVATSFEGPFPASDIPAAAERTAPEANPVAGLLRALRGRWLVAFMVSGVIGPALAVGGYKTGDQLYSSQAILRLHPQESNILYRTGDDSVLKTFDSFAKAETSYVASHPVMEHAANALAVDFPELAADITGDDLTGSIEIKRNDSLIVLTTMSRDPAFAAAKLDAVLSAYFELKYAAENRMSGVRLEELQLRETELLARQQEIRAQMLEVGGEYGLDALARAHVEKVAQIDALEGRLAEVTATLISLESDDVTQSADMSDQEIMRATLLDRALADLNFDRAKREAEMATLITRYPATSPQIRDKQAEIDIIDRSMAERRDQITVLGLTGALTDTISGDAQTSIDDIRALQEEVTGQLEEARSQARDLNGKQIELRGLVDEAEAMRDLLDETRQALEEIRLEAGHAMPGFAEIMSPASLPVEPAEDSRKMQTVMGLAAGLMLSVAGALLLGLMSRRTRYSDAMSRWSHLVPVAMVSARRAPLAVTADRLRDAAQLHPVRAPQLVGKARTVALVRLDSSPPDSLAHALAASFARARLRTLLIDADLATGTLTTTLGFEASPGWREALSGQSPHAIPILAEPHLSVLPCGQLAELHDGAVSVGACRVALSRLGEGYDVVVVNAGSMAETLSAINAEIFIYLPQLKVYDGFSFTTISPTRRWIGPEQGGTVSGVPGHDFPKSHFSGRDDY
jgi:polysaccharide biosynthesis transport protein